MASTSPRPKIIAIVGPTAAGKTDLALALAKKFQGEIVSADSRQIYRGMDIGTAKPTKVELRTAPHHLINIKYPNEEYAVAEYKRDAVAAIRKILEKGRLPILVGGTGLYVKTVLENLDIPKVAAYPALRVKIENDIKKNGLSAAVKRLLVLDPGAAHIVDLKNPRRVTRALEVALTTGRPFTAQRKKSEPLFDALTIGLNPPRAVLRKRINARVDRMMRAGLIKETQRLVKKYGARRQAFDAIGYREVIASLEGGSDRSATAALIKTNTWRYAKRQMTWFKKDKTVRWNNGRRAIFSMIKKWRGSMLPRTRAADIRTGR